MTEPLLFPVQHVGRATRPPRSLYELLVDPDPDVVLQLEPDAAAALAADRATEPVFVVSLRKCRYCGCTDDRACDGGCWWIADDVCSSCGDAARAEGVEVGGIRRRIRASLAIRPQVDRTLQAGLQQAADAGRRAALAAGGDTYAEVACIRCDGCGRLADDDDESPWSAWENLPPESNLAVRLGLVEPHPCPDCGGSGRRLMRGVRPASTTTEG